MTPDERAAVDGRLALALLAAKDIGSGASVADVDCAIDRRLSSATSLVPLLRTGWVEPHWLHDLADCIRRVELAIAGKGPPVMATFSGPSQTGKSAFTEVAMARLIALYPDTFAATVSYGADLTRPRSRRIREDVLALGVELRGDSQSVEHWTTKSGGGLLATGVRGPLTGQPGLGLIVGDDFYKDASEAHSAAYNRELQDFFDHVILTRLGARTSVIIMFARWATNDLIGYIRSRNLPRWEHHTLPVLDANGDPIPKIPGRDRAFYEQQRATMDPRAWAALMMGEPRPRDGRVFLAGAPTYRERPAEFERICIGVDFAYSERKSADHSSAVVVGKTTSGRSGYYVLEVLRRQCGVVEWAAELRRIADRWPAATMHAYIGGTERGTIDTFAAHPYSLRIQALRAVGDKYTRSQATAAKWNGNEQEIADARARVARGELVTIPAAVPRVVYVPELAGWDVRGFVERTLDFSGANGGVDDEQDALVAACDACGTLLPYAPLTQPGRLERSVW